MQMTPKALAALAHSGKSPVAGPLTPCEDLRIRTYSIIAYTNREIGIAKSDFGLDMAGLCMLIRVADRFACNAISLVTNDGSQLAGPAFHDYAILNLRRGINCPLKFTTERAQRIRKIMVVEGGGSQVLDGVASLADRLVSYLHRRVQELRRIARPFRKQLPNCLQSEHQTLEALQ